MPSKRVSRLGLLDPANDPVDAGPEAYGKTYREEMATDKPVAFTVRWTTDFDERIKKLMRQMGYTSRGRAEFIRRILDEKMKERGV